MHTLIRVKVRGLDGFQHELEVAESRLTDGARDLMSDLAREGASAARGKAARDRKSGKAMDSIQAQGPVITAGMGVIYYGFADFGGKVGKGRTISRTYIKGGRYLYPGIKGLGVVKRAENLLDETTKGLQ